jgi:hypothetical protein
MRQSTVFTAPPPIYEQADKYPEQQQPPMMPNVQGGPYGMPAPADMAAPGGYAPTGYPPSQPTPTYVRAAADHAPYIAPPQGAPAAGGPGMYVMYVQPGPTQPGMCPNGQHSYLVNYGVLGIICAILLFPIGLICLLADRKRVCTRCGFVV